MIETIVGATAPLFVKFLLDKVNKIKERKPADSETIRLKEAVEALKNTLESKERASITESDVELVKEKFEQAEVLQRRYNLEGLSDEVFRDWENRLRDKDEDRAIIVMYELETLIRRADALHIREDNRLDLEDMADNISSTLKHLKEEKDELRLFPNTENRDAVEKRERTLKRMLRKAIKLIEDLKAF